MLTSITHILTRLLAAIVFSRTIGTAVFPVEFNGGVSVVPDGVRLRTVTWNVAAVNNNPFEYWITHPDPGYTRLMEDIENFIVDPGSDDVRVDEVFTDAMFRRVMGKIKEHMNIDADMEIVEKMWDDDYRSRRVVSQFLKDSEIGNKRLASMPDRVTNTIQLKSGGSAFRPTVINCYDKNFTTLPDWFEQWLTFFFDQTYDVGAGPKPVHSLLQKIKRAKYPAVTPEEESASIPLQIVLQGVFDAVLVNVMQSKGKDMWQNLRRSICMSLNSRKNERIIEILKKTYADADVIFLQEAGNQLVKLVKDELANVYQVIVPMNYNQKRNQNSVILLRQGMFVNIEEKEVPADGWEAGDLLTVTAKTSGGIPLTLASFHGDTNGLLTAPVLSKVHEHLQPKRLLFGIDANTYEKESKKTYYVKDFEKMYTELGYKSCWGPVDPKWYTTFNARTYLQPQLNKAAKSSELAEKGDRNPKDFILFTKHFTIGGAWRDNTGRGEYNKLIVFPTLEFPSDHAAVAADFFLPSEQTEEL